MRDYRNQLYDSLVSISVPFDRTWAVVDAKEGDMDSELAIRQDLRSLEQKMENHFRRLEQRQSHDSLERSVNFWFGLAFFTLLGVVIVLTRPLA